MRFLPFALLTAVGLAALLVALWPNAAANAPTPMPEAQGTTAAGAARPEVASTSATIATPAQASPTATNPTHDDVARDSAPIRAPRTLVGMLVDTEGHAVAEADLALLPSVRALGATLADLPSEWRARSGADGRFRIGGPDGPELALVVAAAGFVEAQLGDLPSVADHGDVIDVGTLVLHKAVLWHGVVTSGGRGVAKAVVHVLPQLDADSRFAPIAQAVLSDPSGAFVVPAGPCPGLLRVHATGHRVSQARRIDDPRLDLVVELVAVPQLAGRVVRAEDGQPLANAQVAVLTADSHVPGDIRARGARVTTGPDGTFVIDALDAFACYVEVVAKDRVARASGPFATDRSHADITVAMQQGVRLQGRVTWHGEPTSGHVQLLPLADGEPVAQGIVTSVGRIDLPPAPAGHWRLRIGAEHGCLFEREIDLQAPGPLQLDIALADGARLRGQVRGTLPAVPKVTCRHETGWTRGAAVGADGTFEVEHLGPGTWTVHCFGSADWEGTVATMLDRHLPPQTVTVVDERDVRLDIDAPSHRFGRITGSVRDPGNCRVELVPRGGEQAQILRGLLTPTLAADGTFTLPVVVPGEWDVALVRGERTTTVRATVTAGHTTTVSFPE